MFPSATLREHFLFYNRQISEAIIGAEGYFITPSSFPTFVKAAIA
jgi:hypothetical protein